jgi:hypothetical protein
MAQGNAVNGDISQSSGPAVVFVGPALVKAVFAYNHGTALSVLNLYDLARTPILGVDKPLRQFPVPFASTADAATNQIAPTFEEGIPFYNGIAYAVTTSSQFGATGGTTGATGGNMQGHIDFTRKA